MGGEEARSRARELLEAAGRAHQEGDIEEAIRLYRDSIAHHPTADAHTYLGWMYSFQGRTEEAMAECHAAIRLDPEFGNPYNDIGVYLMELGRPDEAIPWLERAKGARRYEPRHFPYMNLGNIYLQKGLFGKALAEFRGALKRAPGDEDLRRVVVDLTTRLN